MKSHENSKKSHENEEETYEGDHIHEGVVDPFYRWPYIEGKQTKILATKSFMMHDIF